MSKPGKSLRNMCKKLGVRLTVKHGKKRVYKSIKVLKRQCANKKKKKVKRRRKFGTTFAGYEPLPSGQRRRTNNEPVPSTGERVLNIANTSGHYPLQSKILGYMGNMNMNEAIKRFHRVRSFIQQKMAIPGNYIKNLQRADLRLTNLHHADFHEAKLQGTLLGGANLFMANLEGAELQGADLQRTNLREANLQGANLYNADLRWANLRQANLQGAELIEAVSGAAFLMRANLSGAILYRADLIYANLRWANLSGANLQRASLADANLREADLRQANLRRADLRGANLRGANLQGTDLRGARYDDDTRFPGVLFPQQRGMVRVNNFGKKRKKRRK